jgi:hypothetical protein
MTDATRRRLLALGASGALLPRTASATLARPALANGPAWDALTLCRQAHHAVALELNSQRTPAYAAAQAEAHRLEMAIERLRARIARPGAGQHARYRRARVGGCRKESSLNRTGVYAVLLAVRGVSLGSSRDVTVNAAECCIAQFGEPVHMPDGEGDGTARGAAVE